MARLLSTASATASPFSAAAWMVASFEPIADSPLNVSAPDAVPGLEALVLATVVVDPFSALEGSSTQVLITAAFLVTREAT